MVSATVAFGLILINGLVDPVDVDVLPRVPKDIIGVVVGMVEVPKGF